MDPLDGDEDRAKGAVEQDRPEQHSNTSLRGQIGHRKKPPMLDTRDTDYPEPGENPEHSGELMQNRPRDEKTPDDREQLEREGDEVQDEVDQDPGERQKRNQNDQEEDPLAA